jgi:hypothetical protein
MLLGAPAPPLVEPPEAGGKGVPPSAARGAPALDEPPLALGDEEPASAQP